MEPASVIKAMIRIGSPQRGTEQREDLHPRREGERRLPRRPWVGECVEHPLTCPSQALHPRHTRQGHSLALAFAGEDGGAQ